MLKRLLLTLGFLALVFGGIFYWKFSGSGQGAGGMSQARPPTVISSAEATLDSWRASIGSVGSLSAYHGIRMGPEISGVVSEIQFSSGQQVTRGQVMLRLDDRVDRAALQVLEAEARLMEAQFARARELLPRKALSQSEFDERQAAVDAARSRVAQQQAILDRKTVRAPFDGVVGLRQVDPGQYIEPGDTIASLQGLDPMYVDYALPERYLPTLAAGQEVEITVAAYPGERFHGVLEALEPDVDVGTRMVRLRATLDNADGRLRPGMYAEVTNLYPGQVSAVTVPRTAVSVNTYGDFLFLIEDDGKGGLVARRQQVVTGEVREGRVVIESGVQVGQRVVRAGLVKLRDGQPVAVDNAVVLDDQGLTQQ